MPFADFMMKPPDASKERMILNIAEGNGRYAYLDRRRFLRTAHSALVKTAAYLDLCCIKGELNEQGTNTNGKELLDRIAAMLSRMEQAPTK